MTDFKQKASKVMIFVQLDVFEYKLHETFSLSVSISQCSSHHSVLCKVIPLFLFFGCLAPDHSRSEMDLSAPGSEHSDDALSLRSRSVPGLNEAVSITPPQLHGLTTNSPQSQKKALIVALTTSEFPVQTPSKLLIACLITSR